MSRSGVELRGRVSSAGSASYDSSVTGSQVIELVFGVVLLGVGVVMVVFIATGFLHVLGYGVAGLGLTLLIGPLVGRWTDRMRRGRER